MGAESKLVAEIVIDNGDAIPLTNATRDALVEAMAATERANQKIEKSEEDVAKALKARVSVSKEVDHAIRMQAAAGKPLEQELVQLSLVYQKLEAAMRSAAKSGGGVPASLSQEAVRVRSRMAELQSQMTQVTATNTGLFGLGQGAGAALAQMAGLSLGIGAVTMGLGQMKQFLGDSITEAIEAERVSAQLAQAMKSQGVFTEGARDRIVAYSDALQRKLGIDDEEITKIQIQLIQLGRLRGQGLERATMAVLNMAASGKELGGSITAVAKAANGKTEALSKMGIVVKATGDHEKDFSRVMDQLDERFGGQAEAVAALTDGSFSKFRTAIGELKEEIGTELLPTLKNMSDFWGEWIAAIPQAIAANREHGDGISTAAESLKTFEFAVSALENPMNRQVQLIGNLSSEQAKLIEQETGLTRTQLSLFETWEENAVILRQAVLRYREYAAAAKAAADETERNADANAKTAETDEEKAARLKREEKLLREIEALETKRAAAVKRVVEAEIERAQISDETARQVFDLKTANDRLTASLVLQRSAGGEIDQEKLRQIAANKEVIAILEAEIRARHSAVDVQIKSLATNDEIERRIIATKARRDELVVTIKRESEKTGEITEARKQELAEIDKTIVGLEAEKEARDKDTDAKMAAARAIARRRVAEEKGANEEIKKTYEQLGASIASTMGTAFVEIAAGEKRGGQIAKQVARDTALAVINAAASEAAAKAIAAHSGIPVVGVTIGLAAAAAIVTAIFAQKRFLAMAGGGELRGGIAGMDSIPIMGMPGENMVDKGTNERLKRMLDAFESGVQTSARGGGGGLGGGGSLSIAVAMPASVVPDSDAAFDRKTEQMIRSIQRAFEMGDIRVPASAVVG